MKQKGQNSGTLLRAEAQGPCRTQVPKAPEEAGQRCSRKRGEYCSEDLTSLRKLRHLALAGQYAVILLPIAVRQKLLPLESRILPRMWFPARGLAGMGSSIGHFVRSFLLLLLKVQQSLNESLLYLSGPILPWGVIFSVFDLADVIEVRPMTSCCAGFCLKN